MFYIEWLVASIFFCHAVMCQRNTQRGGATQMKGWQDGSFLVAPTKPKGTARRWCTSGGGEAIVPPNGGVNVSLSFKPPRRP